MNWGNRAVDVFAWRNNSNKKKYCDEWEAFCWLSNKKNKESKQSGKTERQENNASVINY